MELDRAKMNFFLHCVYKPGPRHAVNHPADFHKAFLASAEPPRGDTSYNLGILMLKFLWAVSSSSRQFTLEPRPESAVSRCRSSRTVVARCAQCRNQTST